MSAFMMVHNNNILKSVASISPAFPVVLSGLVANFDTAPSSGTTWNDTSGNGRNATLNGSPMPRSTRSRLE